MKIAFYGSSLLSSYWNGAATYYRGILRALAERGCEIVFYEPDAFDRQSHRDIDPPAWARSVVYPATPEALREVLAAIGADAEVVTLITGEGAPIGADALEGLLPDGAELEVHAGGQAAWWYLAAAE